MRPKASVTLFLLNMKSFVSKNGLILIPREASLQFMADENMSMSQLIDLVLSLEPKDCFGGPEDDYDPQYKGWTVAKFSPEYGGKPLYLKLSIKVEAERCKCLSIKLYRDKEADGDE